MSWSELSSDQALSEGSSLWIVGDLDSSPWAKKINWYLNFQLRRAEFHQPREISSQLSSVLQTWEIEAPEIKLNPHSPLLVESSKLLPNQLTVQIFSRTIESWIDDAFAVWSDLQQPSVRVFLPNEKLSAKSISVLKTRWQIPEGVSASFVQE